MSLPTPIPAPGTGVSLPEYLEARDAVAETLRPQYETTGSTSALALDVMEALIALGWRKVAEPES